MNIALFSDSTHLPYITKVYSIDATHYWPFAREYLIWNTQSHHMEHTVTSLQFWTADLDPYILSDVIE